MKIFNLGLRLDAGAGGEGGGGGEGNPGGGGTPPSDWRSSIPEDIRTHASLKDFKDIGSLAKSYVHAQSLIGADKVLKPQANWKPEQWASFYDSIGRPKTAEDYKYDEKLIPKDKLDANKLPVVHKIFHDLGLSNSQAQGVMKHYLDTVASNEKLLTDQRAAAQNAGMNALKEEWGEQYQANMDIAKAALRQFGGDDLVEFLNESGLGNDPRLVKAFAKMGMAIMDDTARGSGDGLIVTDATRAQSEINALKGDKEFIAALTNRDAPAHKIAVEKWERLHNISAGQK